jgi:hypothetical protein
MSRMRSRHVLDQPDDVTRIKKVQADEQGYMITREDGWCFAGVTREMVRAARCPEPEVGMEIAFWGEIGHEMRGVMLDGVMLYWRSDIAQTVKHEVERAAWRARRQADLDASRSKRDARRAALPENFRRRLDAFERTNPDWRKEFETYELSCCEDAVKIAAALQTGERVQAFSKAPWEEQRQMVPSLFDGHSGNSFGMAVRLAYWHVTEPENVEREHGGLCALVGCRDYGHTPAGVEAPTQETPE